MDTDIAPPAQGSGAALIEFLSFVGSKGYIKRSTISGFKSACKKILETTNGEKWKEVNVLDLDYDELKKRFENLSPIAPGSLDVGVRNTYMIRFKSSVDLYREYLNNPSVTPTLASRTRIGGDRKKTNQPKEKSKRRRLPDNPTKTLDNVDSAKESSENHDNESARYQFPLRSGFTAYVTLPKDLTYREAKRLSAYIQTLAMDEFSYATVVSGELEN